MLFLAGSHLGSTSPRFKLGFLACVLAVLIVRNVIVGAVWLRTNDIYHQDLAVLDALPEHARLLPAYPPDYDLKYQQIPESHLPTLAVVRRHAFVRTLFHFPAQQPIRFTPEEARFDTDEASPGKVWDALIERKQPPLQKLLNHFDYVVFVGNAPVPTPRFACLAFVAGTPQFQLFRIEKAALPACW
jgi:hypothetical protein